MKQEFSNTAVQLFGISKSFHPLAVFKAIGYSGFHYQESQWLSQYQRQKATESYQRRILQADRENKTVYQAAGTSLLICPLISMAETCLLQARCSFPDIELFVKVSVVKQSNGNVCLWRAFYYIWDSFDNVEEGKRASRTGFINVCCLYVRSAKLNELTY